MECYMNATLARAPWCAADGKVGPWLCAQGCRDGVGRCSTQRQQAHRPCQWLHPAVPAALGSVGSAGMVPAFSKGSDGMKCANPWWSMGTKICLPAACRGFTDMVRQTQLMKVAPFLLCFPFRIQIICAVWKAMALLLQTKHSPASVSAAKLHPSRRPNSTLRPGEVAVICVPEMLPT